MNCDMCGKESRLFKTDVEGSALNLCEGCSKFGRVISVVREPVKEVKVEKQAVSSSIGKTKEEDYVLSVVEDYGYKIKKKREKLGIKQEDLAKSLNEKVSLIHKVEIGHLEPPIELARKLEKFLHINLIEQQELTHDKLTKVKGEGFTIGDFIKIRKR